MCVCEGEWGSIGHLPAEEDVPLELDGHHAAPVCLGDQQGALLVGPNAGQ